ncbi:MAG: FAD-binding oxidoreductase [Acidimicrobiia bacterium]
MTTTVRGLDGGSVELADEVVEELRSRVRGTVRAAPSGGTDVRPPFNAMLQGRPGLVVECTGAADVVDAVNFAREHRLLLTVRGGGHSIAGLSSTDGGLLVDLGAMRGVVVDPDRRLARVQGGSLWADVDREAQAFGLVTPGGVVSDTGVGGLTLGGGYGWVRRKYGLACDALVEAQVVGADGAVRTASAESHPDLFWALRGGGGNFGVVTSFTFRLRPLGPVVAFAGVMYPAEEVASVVRRWRDVVVGAPRELTSITVTFTFPAAPGMPEVVHDRPVTIVGGVYAGDVEVGMAALQPLRELGTPLLDISRPMPFTVVQSSFDALFPRNQHRSYWKSQYLDELTDDAVDAFAEAALARPAPLTVVNIWHMGGAIADVGPEDTAFAERRSPFMVSIDGNWADPAMDARCVAWVRDRWAAMAEHGTGSVYLNFTGDDDAAEAEVDSAYGRNLRRLADVKAAYDPGNLFRHNHNVVPAG